MYGYYGYGYGPGFGWGRGRGRGMGRGRGRGGWGYGATLGYCPWTGMPRGWRWLGTGYYGTGYGPYMPAQYYNPYYRAYAASVQGYGPAAQYTPATYDERTALENEMKYLEQRLKDIDARLKELKR
ncbi:MAG: DUF5320 domain-containing protein [Euryarchaeota archaeon]|nr:DUF5320 domain-containing protein [Euryarchaeota archaeon]